MPNRTIHNAPDEVNAAALRILHALMKVVMPGHRYTIVFSEDGIEGSDRLSFVASGKAEEAIADLRDAVPLIEVTCVKGPMQ
jgi:hypothetical protein